MFARPAQVENQSIRDAGIGEISISNYSTYVRVSGVFDFTRAYSTQYKLGDINLYGSRFVPFYEPGMFDAIYVIDENLPTRDPTRQATIVAQVLMGTGAQPPIYLQVGSPPNVVMANALARIGTALLVLVVVVALITWVIERMDYAIPLPWSANDEPENTESKPALLWFGELGRQYNEVVLRSQPAEFNATPHEARIDSANPKGQWSVSIRRLMSAQLFEVATPYGSLPAARLRFEDERGLQRRGVIAAQSTQTRDAMLQVLSLIR